STGNIRYDEGYSITVDQQGRIYVAGTTYRTSSYNMIVIRLTSDGRLDESFDYDGVAIFGNIGDVSIANGTSIAVDNNHGKVYVLGGCQVQNNYFNYDIVVLRLNSDGSLDTSFGNGGKLVIRDVAGDDAEDYEYSMVLDGNGNLFITGASYTSLNDGDLIVIKVE
ncbi:MAG: delta-60 repeat domain-containing protein, partial [bacterium]|nr:delta-60 repeat domain-containing protein [bacterium]